jgi:hypothetical protein
MSHIKITCNIKGNIRTRSCKSPNVPKISLQVYRTRIRNRRDEKLKQRKGGFKDTFSEGTEGHFAGHVQEENSLLMPMSKKFY